MRQRYGWISPLLGGLLLARASLGGPATRSVVFVEPSSEELDRSLRDALTAQLSGGPAELVFDHFSEPSAPLRRQMSEAETLAHAHAASGVFWIDAQPDGDWLLYLSEPGGERTLVRRIAVEASGTAAAVEAVAVITRQSADALLAGGTIGMQSVSPRPVAPEATPSTSANEPETPPSVAPARKRPSSLSHQGISLSVAYGGDYVAKAVGWQSGVSVAGGYRFPFGFYLAGGYTFFRDTELDATPLVLRITRNPLYLEAGYSFGHGRWVPSLGGRAIIESLSRHTVSTSGSLAGTPDNTRTDALLSPRLRLDFALTPGLAVYGAIGADFALNRFSFVSRVGGGDAVLLEPNIVRPSIELGLSLWP